jgi:hypothetical protein
LAVLGTLSHRETLSVEERLMKEEFPYSGMDSSLLETGLLLSGRALSSTITQVLLFDLLLPRKEEK